MGQTQEQPIAGVAPVGSGAAGGITPVTGGESVEGAGMGGLGQAAKDKARSVGAASSTSNMGTDTGE